MQPAVDRDTIHLFNRLAGAHVCGQNMDEMAPFGQGNSHLAAPLFVTTQTVGRIVIGEK
jgi:hypothetical protein